MSEWREVTLGDVIELKRGYDLPTRARSVGPYPIVSSSGINGSHAEAKVRGPGVVTGRYGTLGQVFYITGDFWPLNTSLYVRDFKGNNPRFVAVLLESMDLAQHDGAAAVPGINRNQLHIVPVRVPDRAAQDRIAAIMESIDDLIENNRRRVEVLEEMARAIYREWFVRFRYPGHEHVPLVDSPLGPIPDGWEISPLFDVVDVGFGFSFKSKQFSDSGPIPVIRIRDVPNGTTKTYSDEVPPERYRVVDGDVLIGMDGEFHLRQWTGGDAWLNQRVTRLRPTNGLSPRHLMLAVTGPIRDWNAAISGTTVAHLGKRHLEQIQILSPPHEVLDLATPLFDDLANQACTLVHASRQLTAIRDLLLPKLVTGQIDVSHLDLDSLTEAAIA
jgi:type I restriction enzyme S subunit